MKACKIKKEDFTHTKLYKKISYSCSKQANITIKYNKMSDCIENKSVSQLQRRLSYRLIRGKSLVVCGAGCLWRYLRAPFLEVGVQTQKNLVFRPPFAQQQPYRFSASDEKKDY